MQITKSMVKKLRITGVDNLDPITVIAENFGPGAGKIIIECFGESWSHFWSHMGEQYTLESFFCKASDDYIGGKLCHGRSDEPDWDGMPDRVRKEVVKMRRARDIEKHEAREFYDDASSIDHEVSAHQNSEMLGCIFGDEWFFHIPDRPTREWRYLMKIIPVVRDAFKKEMAESELLATA